MIKYEDIARNVEKTAVEGDVITVTWKDPISEDVVGESNARMKAPKGLKEDMTQEMLRGALRQAKYWVARIAGQLLGRAASDTVRRMGTTVETHLQKGLRYGEEEQKAGVIEAWEKIQDRFVYSDDCHVYVKKEQKALSDGGA